MTEIFAYDHEEGLEIPTLNFAKSDYDKNKNEIIINLNFNRHLDEEINKYKSSHRRLLPQINLISPTGGQASFDYPKYDGWEIVYEGKKCNVRLVYK